MSRGGVLALMMIVCPFGCVCWIASMFELARGVALPTKGEEYSALRRGDVPNLPCLSPAFNDLLYKMMDVRCSSPPLLQLQLPSQLLVNNHVDVYMCLLLL